MAKGVKAQTELRRNSRNSNFELLRIIAMLFIVVHHYTYYSPFDFSDITIINKIVIHILRMGGKLGADIFVLISGYFSATQTQYRWKGIVKFVFQVTMVSLIEGTVLFLTGQLDFSLKTLLAVVFPLLRGDWWFVGVYFVLMLIAPFLSRALNCMSRREHFCLMMLLIVLCSVLPTFSLGTNFESGNILWFIILFITASFIRKYPDKYNSSKKLNIALFSMCTVLLALSIIILDIAGLKVEKLGSNSTRFIGLNSIFITIQAIAIVNVFKSMKPFSSVTVNKIASAMFGVYLIHDFEFIRPILWGKLCINAESYQNSPWLIVYALITVAAVFVVCTAISCLYNALIDRPLSKLLDKKEGSIVRIYNKFKNKAIKVLSSIGAKVQSHLT